MPSPRGLGYSDRTPTAAAHGGRRETRSRAISAKTDIAAPDSAALDSAEEKPRCRLYLITPPTLDPESFKPLLEEALGAGDVACLQLRLKGASDDEIRKAVKILMPVAHAHDVAFLINDRPDLARELDADGAHLGQEDMSYQEARALLGPDRIVGVTCHNSRHLAMTAGEAGADYVAFGAFFPTATKEAKTRAEAEILAWWSEIFEVPCVAIGGITVDNCSELVAAGADFIAVVGGVWDYPEGPAAAVRAFNEKIDKARAN